MGRGCYFAWFSALKMGLVLTRVQVRKVKNGSWSYMGKMAQNEQIRRVTVSYIDWSSFIGDIQAFIVVLVGNPGKKIPVLARIHLRIAIPLHTQIVELFITFFPLSFVVDIIHCAIIFFIHLINRTIYRWSFFLNPSSVHICALILSKSFKSPELIDQ